MSSLEHRTQLTGVIPGQVLPLLCRSASTFPSLSPFPFLPLRSNIELILCLFLGAKARGGCVFVCVCASWSRRCCLDGCFILAPVAIATLWDFQCVWTSDPIDANQHQQQRCLNLSGTHKCFTTQTQSFAWVFWMNFQLKWTQISGWQHRFCYNTGGSAGQSYKITKYCMVFLQFLVKSLISLHYWPPTFSPNVYPVRKMWPYPRTRQ